MYWPLLIAAIMNNGMRAGTGDGMNERPTDATGRIRDQQVPSRLVWKLAERRVSGGG